ncbi:fatty acid hydroxylase domain-containing protein 2-like [Pimephales promelas]|uniref:fatty acid hydroxylase domain-containing protein 2-like n=1 Tax=Pimephales promelas TaxID=90988 RepID=UPI001955563E|nr:fatty acid hydroxylase domain-containing protein 2-like [Pimephales promelas]KAG1924689.1 fatty acid hydroxylase domain-containing protein [Pimephales promelas]
MAVSSCTQTVSMDRGNSGGLWDSVKKAAFVIGSGLFFLVGFRNSVTWHLQRFWGASGDFWQTQWTKLHQAMGGNEAALFFIGTMLVPTLSFWLFNALLMLVDTTGKPSFITRYRIQPDKNNPVPSCLNSEPRLFRMVRESS